METNFNNKDNFNSNSSTANVIVLDFSNRFYAIFIAIVIICGMVGLSWTFAQFIALSQDASREINVSGQGRVYIKPDIAITSFGLLTEGKDSQKVVNENNEKMSLIIKSIKDIGVKDNDIQTILYNLSPVYEYQANAGLLEEGRINNPNLLLYHVPGKKSLKGYSLEQRISVKIRDFDKINSILNAASQAGASHIGDLQFAIDDPESARFQAREKAIKNAKEKIKSLAQQSGLRIGKLINVSEGYDYPYPFYQSVGTRPKDNIPASAPEIQIGQMEIYANVTLTYQVK